MLGASMLNNSSITILPLVELLTEQDHGVVSRVLVCGRRHAARPLTDPSLHADIASIDPCHQTYSMLLY